MNFLDVLIKSGPFNYIMEPPTKGSEGWEDSLNSLLRESPECCYSPLCWPSLQPFNNLKNSPIISLCSFVAESKKKMLSS